MTPREAAEAVDALWDEPDDVDDKRDGLIWMTQDETAMAAALRALRAVLRPSVEDDGLAELRALWDETMTDPQAPRDACSVRSANDLHSHASFRVEGGEPGAAHDPGLAEFRPDTLPSTQDNEPGLLRLLASPDLPPFPWRSPADREPWPDAASDPDKIVDANGKSIFSRNWKETCAAVEFMVRAANRAALSSRPTSDTGSLDIRRLARAMTNALWPNWSGSEARRDFDAEKLAAEYQRLASKPSVDPEETP